MQKTAVLFDLDGTLVDTIELIMRSMEFAFDGYDGVRPTREQWLLGLGIPLRDCMAKWARTDAELDWLVARYRIYQTEHHDRMTVPYPGVVEVLDELRARGHPMGVITSKFHALAGRVLRHVGFAGHFGTVVGADSIANPKPHREPVFKALEDLGHTGGRAIFVGDSPHDIRSGHDAGIQTGAALWGPFTREHHTEIAPTHWLTTITDLPAIVS